jgi:hypothetical protein
LVYFAENEDKFVVPHDPDEFKIYELLLNCLEDRYGGLGKFGIDVDY